jgi:putative chitinase
MGGVMKGVKWLNLGVPSAASKGPAPRTQQMLANIPKIPKGSVVLVALGANDTANAMVPGKPSRTAQSIASDVSSVVDRINAQQPSKVLFLLFPNGPGRGSKEAKFYGGEFQEEVRTAIRSALGGIPIIDINGKPLTDGVHAGMSTYKVVASQVVSSAKPTAFGSNEPGSSSKEEPKEPKSSLDRFGNKVLNKIGLGDKEQASNTSSDFIATPSGAKMGSRGVEVINLQRGLIALGYDVGPTKDDGIIGKFTTAAIAKFQTDNKLPPSGFADKETVDKVNELLKARPAVLSKLEKAKPEEFKGKITVSALGDKASRELLTQAAESQGIKGKELAAFLAQCSHESGGFRYLSEIWGPTSQQKTYDGRMGNNSPGDGFKYRGRGFIQLTGKKNYADASRVLGVDLVKNPELAEKPEMGAKTSIYFWKTNVQPNVSNWDDTRTITRIVNGGYNGLEDRKMRYAAFKQDMNLA